MTFAQDIGIFEAVAGNLIAFAGGQPVTATKTIGKLTVSAKAVHLPNGPTADYQVFSGSFVSMLGLAFQDGLALSSGAPISIAEKIGNTWYGETVSLIPAD